LTRKPCDSSQLVMVSISFSAPTPKPLPKFSRVSQWWKFGDFLSYELVDQFVERLFLLGRALQQEEHVIDVEAVRDRPPDRFLAFASGRVL